MGDVARPMLAEVLAALTDTLLSLWTSVRDVALSPYGASGINDSHSHIGLFPWTVADPADAQECLVSRGLLPDGWCGDARRGWHCEECGGEGYQRPTDDTNTDPYTGGGAWRCRACGSSSAGRGLLDCAATIPDIVAVASLGWPAVQRAEELARAACAALRECGCPQPERVVWRVGTRDPDRFIYQTRSYAADPRGGFYEAYRKGYSLVSGAPTPTKALEELWDSGLAIDAITADAVRIVVPPVGGAR